MSNLNRLKVVDFTAGRLSSDDINTDIPFRDNFDKTRTIQQANAVIGAYVNRNYKDMSNKADKDEIPTKVSELENDEGYITTGDIPSKTSDLVNDGADGEHPFITKEVDNLTNYTDTETLNTDLGLINGDISDINTNLQGLNEAIDLQLPNRIGDIAVDSIRSKNMFNKNNVIYRYYYDNTGTLQLSDNWAYEIIEVKPNTNYYLSGNNYNNTVANIVLLNSSKTFINSVGGYKNVGLITTTNTTKYIGLSIAIYGGAGDLDTLQLEKGSSATPYRPYQNLNGMETYSTEEIVIGTFLGKPLYRKVITRTVNANTNDSVSLSSLGITNQDTIIINTGLSTAHYQISTVGGGYAPIVYYVSNTDRAHVYVNAIKELQIQNQNNNQREYKIVLEYTKTTD